MLTISKYPVENSGTIKNCLPGFLPIIVEMERRDGIILALSEGTDITCQLLLAGDLRGIVNVGESVYFYSVGIEYTYDVSSEVLEITYDALNDETTIRVAENFIENTTSGYCNYKQDWYVEGQLVNADNPAILAYRATLTDDGKPNGNINFDVSIPVDLLSQPMKLQGGQIVESRIKYLLKYRESYRNNRSIPYTLLNDIPIINTYSIFNTPNETFVQKFDTPVMWLGYPNAIAFLHSDANSLDKRLVAYFDELDINTDVITADNFIRSFRYTDYGFLLLHTKDVENFILNDNTQFVQIKMQIDNIPDYFNEDYSPIDYFAQ